MTTQTDFTTLNALADQFAQTAGPLQIAATSAAEAATADVNRLTLAQTLLDAEIPVDAVIDIYDWADEPNADGTYDMDVSEAYFPDGGEVLDDLAGQGAVPAGHTDGGTDWDIFLVDDAPECTQIAAAKVYDWLRQQTTPVLDEPTRRWISPLVHGVITDLTADPTATDGTIVTLSDAIDALARGLHLDADADAEIATAFAVLRNLLPGTTPLTDLL